jgi:hypothetical protein
LGPFEEWGYRTCGERGKLRGRVIGGGGENREEAVTDGKTLREEEEGGRIEGTRIREGKGATTPFFSVAVLVLD